MFDEIAKAIGYHFWHPRSDREAIACGGDCAAEVMKAIEAAQLRVNSDPCSRCCGEGWVLNDGFVKVQCPECKNARAGYAS